MNTATRDTTVVCPHCSCDCDKAKAAERAKIVKAIRGWSKPTEKDHEVAMHIAMQIERGML